VLWSVQTADSVMTLAEPVFGRLSVSAKNGVDWSDNSGCMELIELIAPTIMGLSVIRDLYRIIPEALFL
jgi:hypothetical protein